jgi:hypothetical protein
VGRGAHRCHGVGAAARGEPGRTPLRGVARIGVPEGDGIGDICGTDGEPIDDEVGDERAGRLVAPDEGSHENTESDLFASDIGLDGAGASAEEAAMHVIPDTESS